MYPAGALYTPDAEGIVNPVSKLSHFARENKIQVVSTADAHAEDDPEFNEWRPHCVCGTAGQQKVAGTVLKDPLVLTTAPDALNAIQSRIGTAAQIIVQKQKIDCFTNPHLEALLASLSAERFVVYGLLTEFCLHQAIFGLLDMGFQVEVVTDAIKSLDEGKGRAILEQFRTAGGQLTTLQQVIG